jgi:hypothetical protein
MAGSKQEGGSVVGRAATWLERRASSTRFHYATLALLQAKVLWGIFAHREMTLGDTVSYFRIAEAFSRELTCVIHWSPLYTSFFGSFLWLGDARFAVTAHRVVAVCALSLLAWEILRRLLPLPLAWMLTAWWILLPTVHETLYEVHLFAAAPVLGIGLWLLCREGPRARGVAVAGLLAVTVLVRNEYVIALAVFGALALVHELRRDARRLATWALPLLVVVALIAGAYARSRVQLPDLARGLDQKHRVNVAQIYAFGYGQRHPEYDRSPWTDYADLLEATFGRARPTLWEALVANPPALARHFLWNLRLVPSGLQTALLGARVGHHRPGYAATPREPLLAGLGTALLLAVWVVGARRLFGPERALLASRLARHRWAFLYLGSVAVTLAVVAVVQRPRPAYLFPGSVALVGWTGLCLLAIARAWPRWRPPAWAGAAAPLLVLLVAPSYWARREPPRPVASYYRALEAHRELFPNASVGIGVPAWSEPLGIYLQRGSRVRIAPLHVLLEPGGEAAAVTAALDAAHVPLWIVDELRLPWEELRVFAADPPPPGWRALERGEGWALLQRSGPADESSPSPAPWR